MKQVVNILINDLRLLIRDLGKDGGLIGPSVYDTAQVIRKGPPSAGTGPALQWLIEQQQPDGGWGPPNAPLARAVPTLAALLTIHTYARGLRERKIIQAGLAFLREQKAHWPEVLPDNLPVGIELLLPGLLDDAANAGLDVPREAFGGLTELGNYRRRTLARIPIRAGTPPLHLWETWGKDATPNMIDGAGGIGHSPAATAAWLRATNGRADMVGVRAAAHRYLKSAAAATGMRIPGVVPTVWPITRFEQSFGLYILLISGLIDHPLLKDIVQPQIDELARSIHPLGLGMSDCFTPDGDDTAVGLAVLRATNHPARISLLDQFAHRSHFCAYAGELQPSISVTAHAVHALRLYHQPYVAAQQYMIDHQGADGSWPGDKWNNSWLYTTSQVIISLASLPHLPALQRATAALIDRQDSSGGWGGVYEANAEETAYGVLALRSLVMHGVDAPDVLRALGRAERWMLNHYRTFIADDQPCWLGKESYLPNRIVRMLRLVATFPSTELFDPLNMSRSSIRAPERVPARVATPYWVSP